MKDSIWDTICALKVSQGICHSVLHRNGNKQVWGMKAERQFEPTLGGKVLWCLSQDSDHRKSTKLPRGSVSGTPVLACREPWCMLVERMPQLIGSCFQMIPLCK